MSGGANVCSTAHRAYTLSKTRSLLVLILMSSTQRYLSFRRVALYVTGLMLVAALTGCSNSTANKVAAMNDTNIKRVCHLYAAYQSRHGWAGPKDEDGFKHFVTQDMEEEKLAMMGVDPSKLDAVM